MPTIEIDVVSDLVCPWCYIGKRRLEEALAMSRDVEAIVRWRPFQLAPDLPPEGVPRAKYLADKFGSQARAETMFKRVAGVGHEVGLDLDFDKIDVSPNTLDAHRVVLWAGASGKQDAVVEALFAAYFTKGENLANRAVLAKVAGDAGLDGALIADLLAGDIDIDRTRADIAQAKSLGISGVPFFIFGGRYAVSGAEAPETLEKAMRAAIAAEAGEPATA